MVTTPVAITALPLLRCSRVLRLRAHMVIDMVVQRWVVVAGLQCRELDGRLPGRGQRTEARTVGAATALPVVECSFEERVVRSRHRGGGGLLSPRESACSEESAVLTRPYAAMVALHTTAQRTAVFPRNSSSSSSAVVRGSGGGGGAWRRDGESRATVEVGKERQ